MFAPQGLPLPVLNEVITYNPYKEGYNSIYNW